MKVTRYALTYAALMFILATASWSQDLSREEAIKAYKAGNYAESIDILKQITKGGPEDAEAWHLLGASYVRQSKSKDAVKSLKRQSSFNRTMTVSIPRLATPI